MFEYFYHEILRKTIISFGNLFNNITIEHKNENNDIFSTLKVPLAYGPTQKFLARLEQSPNLSKPIQITLPRMSFELVGLSYDGSRKVTTTQSFKAPTVVDKNDIRKTYMPVPYNMEFELSIMAKLNDDMLQIIEQILPYFQPTYNLTVDLISTIGEKRDIPIVFEGITMQDDYEGDFSTRRVLLYTLRFVAKTYLFGPVSGSSVSSDIIKKVSIGYISGDLTKTPSRELTYSVEPRAIKSYTNNSVTSLTNDIGDSSTSLTVNDASSITSNSYIVIDNEELQVLSIDDNTLKVSRGQDGTKAESHVAGSSIKLLTAADNALIQAGDDFGFDGSL
jgi:translation elongation factor P/translation initiation factor 5A